MLQSDLATAIRFDVLLSAIKVISDGYNWINLQILNFVFIGLYMCYTV